MLFKHRKKNKLQVSTSRYEYKKEYKICITTKDWNGHEEYSLEIKQGKDKYYCLTRDMKYVIDDINEFILNDGHVTMPPTMI